MRRGVMIAAARSGAGKTTLTLGLLRALRDAGYAAAAAKSGPDYIDPAFHAAACGRPSVNLDAWAMGPDQLRALAHAQSGEPLIIEGAMGLFDGAADGRGAAADLAAALKVPVIIALDVEHQGQTAAATALGLARFRDDITVAGVVLNRVGSARHEGMVRRALDGAGLRVFGAVPRETALALPSRHLGLVQAAEHPALEAFLSEAGARIAACVNIEDIAACAATIAAPAGPPGAGLPPFGQRVAIARDEAFAFAYPHSLTEWRAAGAELTFFSPLADEAPDEAADAVYLPGGYPELHAPRLAAAQRFAAGMRDAAARGAVIYGECGGYMALGRALEDAQGKAWPMLGLLPVITSFAKRKLHLGYRRALGLGGPWRGDLSAHEFHYATEIENLASPLFEIWDSDGKALPKAGACVGNVSGSYAHIIARPSPTELRAD